jgi:hypothetical protein
MPVGPLAKVSDDELVALIQQHGALATSAILKVNVRSIHARRAQIEAKRGGMVMGHKTTRPVPGKSDTPGRLHFEIENGVVIAGSDAHYWPDRISTAHRAFVKFCKEMKPKAVVLNGDMFDGASVSRHPPIGWENCPTVVQEIETTQDRLDEIAKASGKAHKFWPLGNHDARFSMRLAASAPEYAQVKGFALQDHFPLWAPCWSVWINNSLVIKHRYKGGIHAPWNNTVMAGMSIATGHLHSSKVTPFTDYNGDRWGVDLGTMADPFGPQFEYQEDNPRNHRSGFGVFTFWKGRLLWPELVSVMDEGQVQFRGQVFQV